MKVFIITYLIFTAFAIPMCIQESKRRKISFLAALALSLAMGLILPIIGFIGAYIIISGIKPREEQKNDQALDEGL